MAEINTVIAEASQDLQTIEDFVNLPAGSVVNPRLLPSVDVGTLAGARQAIFEAGGLPATPFANYSELELDTTVPRNGYGIVLNDADIAKNGLYIRYTSSWGRPKFGFMPTPDVMPRGVSLDTLEASAFYAINSTTLADDATGYPSNELGFLQVIAPFSTGYKVQVFYGMNGDIFIRTKGTSWRNWVKSGGDAVDLSAYLKIADAYTGKRTIGAEDVDAIKEPGIYIKNNINVGDESNGYPTNEMGVLEVSALSTTSFKMHVYTTIGGMVFARFWNGSQWSAWKSSGGSAQVASDKSLLEFNKNNTTFTIFKKGINNNDIRFIVARQIKPEINLDAWGIATCVEVDSNQNVVRQITRSGVWEFASWAVDNTSDHVGGSHGDEVLDTAFFMIDGVYHSDSFNGSGQAREIKLFQKSTIYIEDSLTDVLCKKEVEITFTAEGVNLKQRIKWEKGRELITAYLAMMPVLRKANSDNTGEQITDTEVRSQDMQVIDVSEPGFTMRNLPLSNGDSVNLSGSDSKVSASVTVNEIVASTQPYTFVQNTNLYNKIYISGMPSDGNYTVNAGDEWYIDATFKVTTRN